MQAETPRTYLLDELVQLPSGAQRLGRLRKAGFSNETAVAFLMMRSLDAQGPVSITVWSGEGKAGATRRPFTIQTRS